MSAGTIALTNNSKNFTGSGTTFTTELTAGAFVVVTIGQVPYTLAVESVTSNTAAVLSAPFDGPTASGLAWDGVPVNSMALATMGVTTQAQKALRMLIADATNWRSIYSNAASVTVTLPNGQTYTGPSWGYMSNQLSDITTNKIPALDSAMAKKANNLSDLPDKATARSNLQLGNSATRDVDNQFPPTSSYINGAAVMAQVHRDYRNLGSYDGISQYPLGMSFGIQLGGNGWGGGSGVDTYTGMLTLRGWHDSSGGGYVSWQLASTSQGLKYRQGNGTIQGNANVGFSTTHTIWATQNTTVDTNGFIKRASPIVKIFGNGIGETNEESEGATVSRLGVGEYQVSGVMGLNSDLAWGGVAGGIEVPCDINSQPILWVDYEVMETGDLIVRTYHREHPGAPIFAQNKKDGYGNGDPIDIPSDVFVSVRVEMPENSIYNQRMNADFPLIPETEE